MKGLTDGSGAPAPVMVVEPRVRDFGLLSADADVMDVFQIRNDGDAPLTVPEPGASEVRLELVADDTLVLSERTVWVVP